MIINYFSPAMQGGPFMTRVLEEGYSGIDGYEPSLRELPGGSTPDHAPVALIPLSEPINVSTLAGGAAKVPYGSMAVLAPGGVAHTKDGAPYIAIPMPGSRMGTMVAFDHGGKHVRGDASVVYRPMIETSHDYSAGRMTLRNEFPYAAAASDRVTSYTLLRGEALAIAWRPDQDYLVAPMLSMLSEYRITPMGLLNKPPGREAETLQDVLETTMRSFSPELSSNPDIGSTESGLLFAHPLIERTVVTVYPGEHVMLVSVASWGTPEFIVLTSC